MSTEVHGTTCAQAREPGRRDNGLANDVRVSPTDEGAGAAPGEEVSHAARRPRTAASGSPPSSKSGARQTSFLAHLGSVLFQSQCAVRCHRMNSGETTLHMPEKKISEDDCLQKTSSTTPRAMWQNCRSKNRRIARTTSVDLLLHAPGFGSISKQTCQNVPRELGVLFLEPPENVSESDGEKKAPLVEPPTRCQTERPEDLPLGRETCHEKSKGTGAAVG